MKLLKTTTHPEYPTPDIETVTREAARVVLVDDEGMVPLIYSKSESMYKIPGGGIDEGESIIEACKREALEETGCEIEILGEIGEIINAIPAKISIKGVNLYQISYCFYGKVISKGQISLTDEEIQRGFRLEWIHKDHVLTSMQQCTPSSQRDIFLIQREISIFEKYVKLQK